MDQHCRRRQIGETFQSPQRRFLPCAPSGHRLKKLKASSCKIVEGSVGLADHDTDGINPWVIRKQADSAPQNRFAAEGLILLWNVTSDSFALSTSNEQRYAPCHLSRTASEGSG